MSYAFLDCLQWDAESVEHYHVEMTEGMRSGLRDFQGRKQHVILRRRRTFMSQGLPLFDEKR
jgi:hypothetical protein